MNTTTINAGYDLKNGIRTPGSIEPLLKANLSEMIEAITADEVRLVASKEGKRFLHILNSGTGRYFPIGLGPSVATSKTGNDLIVHLFEKYVVYTGTYTNESGTGVWFRFGTEPTSNAPLATMSMDALKNVKFYAGSS